MADQNEQNDQTEDITQVTGEVEQDVEIEASAVKECSVFHKSERIQHIEQNKLPPTYLQNSQRETLLLDYASQFESTFLTQYAQRKPLFISPMNEARVQKFLPTTLRPAVLADPDLINGNKLSKFVSNSIDYVELEDPTAPPQHIVAPQTILEWQQGDCYDMSILLTSLLIGAGYNAFVVSGYADRRLTQQIRRKEHCREDDGVKELMQWVQRGFAAEATFAHRYKQGIFKVDAKYCRDVTDFKEVETKFQQNDWIMDQQKPVLKEIENFWFRVEVEPDSQESLVNMKVNNQEIKEKIIEARVQELKYCLMQGGDLVSDRSKSYGYSLLCLPDGADLQSVGGWFSNKYIQPRPLLQDSEFIKIEKMRQKMEAIGATKLEIESYVIEEMRKQHKLDDILIPGETGQRVKADEQKKEKQKQLKEKQHISDLCNDTLQGQRVYSWVYVAPLQPKDAKLPVYNKNVETDVNVLISQLGLPTDVKNGMFIDAPSGRVFTIQNDLFLGIESMFNHENYFVNLQDNTNGIKNFTYDIYDMDNWCICIMTQQMVEIRQAQKDYKNKLQVQESIINEVGGKNNLFLQGINNTNQQITVPGDQAAMTVNGLKAGIDLPQKIQDRIDQKLKDDEQKNYQTNTRNKHSGDKTTDFQADVLAIQRDTIQSIYQQRWDSVTPVRLLMSSLPASWPVQTTLSDMKILQNYPLRPKLNYEKVNVDMIPEKTMLYKDCFVRQFNEYSQRSGCVLSLVARPRPVFSYFYDNDGDKIGQEITGWRVIRYQFFKNRVDKLKVKETSFHIQNTCVELQDDKIDPDPYLQKNDGSEFVTELDTKMIIFNSKLYPSWCFVGEDLDFIGLPDNIGNLKLISVVNENQAAVISNRQIFKQGRPDMLLQHINMPSGLRKTYFYPNRSDCLGCVIHHMGHKIESRYFDLMRLDGLKNRIVDYSQDPIVDKQVIKMAISEFREDELVMKDVQVFVTNVQEEFRDLGNIQKTINKRRRRLIQAKYAVINADLKELKGIKEAEDKAEEDKKKAEGEENQETEQQEKKSDNQTKLTISDLDKEDALMNCDIFGDVEQSLTQAAYNIFVAQKQLFTQNQSSAYNPLYQVQQGVLQMVKRQEDSLMLAYNLCPDIAEQNQAQGSAGEGQSATQDQTLNQTDASNLSSSQIEDSQQQSEIEGEDAGGRTGAAFWRRTAKILQQQDCSQTTDFLKDDINQLINDRQINLPKSIATKLSSADRKDLVDNELRKSQITNLIGVKMNYFDKSQNMSKFDLSSYVTLLKKREMPIFPQFDSGPLSYEYVKQVTKDPFRIQQINYLLTKNMFRVLDFADEPQIQNVQMLFDHDQGYVHFSKVFLPVSDLQTHLAYYLAEQLYQKKQYQLQQEQLLQSSKQSAFTKKPPAHLQQIQTNAPYQTTRSLQINEQYDETLPKTSVMKISVEDTLIGQRQQQLSQQLNIEYQSLFEVINSLERSDETKIVSDMAKQQGISNVLMLQYRTRAQGLYFRPRDLTVARHALAQHGLEDRFNLQVEAVEKQVKSLNGSDYLAVFIPEKYRNIDEPLPMEIAVQVFQSCLNAMKERIMERSGIIQSRLQSEMEFLKKKNIVYNKSVTQLSEENKRTILAEIRESIFRLKILEHRSNRHSQEGAQRYVELEQRLRNDKRLDNLKKSQI